MISFFVSTLCDYASRLSLCWARYDRWDLSLISLNSLQLRSATQARFDSGTNSAVSVKSTYYIALYLIFCIYIIIGGLVVYFPSKLSPSRVTPAGKFCRIQMMSSSRNSRFDVTSPRWLHAKVCTHDLHVIHTLFLSYYHQHHHGISLSIQFQRARRLPHWHHHRNLSNPIRQSLKERTESTGLFLAILNYKKHITSPEDLEVMKF